ncbi:hypothetical protein BC940DRAFT_305473 [Gongronella butleri]|nr:hypothetical protein BC940DRAFT_305473 [Gongronella butleri]
MWQRATGIIKPLTCTGDGMQTNLDPTVLLYDMIGLAQHLASKRFKMARTSVRREERTCIKAQFS